MPKIYPYIPPTYEVRERPEPLEYETLQDILDMDFIKRFLSREDFYKFSRSGNHLMLELRDGYEWHVVATIENIEALDLPEWDKGRTKVTDGNEEFTVEGVDVYSYCGSTVTMKDGRILKSI